MTFYVDPFGSLVALTLPGRCPPVQHTTALSVLETNTPSLLHFLETPVGLHKI